MSNLVRIDELILSTHQHGSLSLADECYYLLEYTAHQPPGYSRGNDLILDLKKSVSKKALREWRYKERAIGEIAGLLRAALPPVVDFDKTTLIPIPPSRTRTDPFYDDRNLRILRQACPEGADIRELILTRANVVPSHERVDRPSAGEILKNYMLHPDVSAEVRETVVLFDDMITGGNHFVASKKFVENHCHSKKTIGIFIARRIL